MQNNIMRIAQAPPPPPAAPPAPMPDLGGGAPPPPMGGGMDLGMSGLGMPPPPGGAPTGTGAALTGPKPFPLENVGMILQDAEVQKLLSEKFSNTNNIDTTGEEEIANEIWIQYGGSKKSGIAPGRVGEREEKKEVSEREIENTDDSRWKRLPKGETLKSLGITLQNMVDAVKAISFGMSKERIKGTGGAGGPMASSKQFIKIANELDTLGFYHLADKMM
jgi:hypothetical protein